MAVTNLNHSGFWILISESTFSKSFFPGFGASKTNVFLHSRRR